MKFKEAQEDMRNSYYGGSPGAFASGVVWLTAGIIALLSTKQISVLVFFFGGMLIHPLGILLSKALNRSGKHKKGNPLSHLALESTFMLFIGLFIAFLTLQIRPNWFFSIMILIIGGRYFVFSSIYGNKKYAPTYFKTTVFNDWGRSNEIKKTTVFKMTLKDQKTQLFKINTY